MEERTSLTGNGRNSIRKLSTATSLRVAPSRKLSTATSLRLAPSPPPDQSSGTYVVQIPRDQVYRVPPPENAKIAENFRPPKDNTQRNRAFGCCCWVLLGLLSIGIVIGVIIGVIHLMYLPKCPNFSVVSVNFKNVTDNDQKNNQSQQRSKFEFDLKVDNVNERMDVSFGQGKTKFVFKKNEIGQGKYPSKNKQKPKRTNNVHLDLDVGSNGTLPNELLKILEDDKKQVPITLMIYVPMEIKSWFRNVKKNNLEISCDFDVEQLTKKAKIMPNDCITDF